MEETKKESLDWITFLQAFAVVLVMIGHSLPNLNGSTAKPEWALYIFKLIYTFHMPLFFIIGGYLLAYSFARGSSTIQDFSTFIKKKAKRIIIPYIALGTLSYLLKIFIFNRFAYRPADTGIMPYINSLLYPWDNPNGYLWFLPTMFAILLVYYFIADKNRKTIYTFTVISLAVGILSAFINIKFLNIKGILYYQLYFMLGIVIYNFKNRFFNLLSNNYIFIAIVFILFTLLYTTVFNDYTVLVTRLRNILVAVCGIVLSIYLAIKCSDKNIKFAWGLLDGKYYQLYLISWYWQCLIRILYQVHLVSYPVVCVLMFAVGSIILPLLTIYVIKKYIPQLKIFIGL